MALVICRVFFTLRIRRRRSSTFAIVLLLVLQPCEEASLVLIDRCCQTSLEIVIQRLLRRDIRKDGRLRSLQVRIVAIFERAKIRNLNVIQQAVDACVDDRNLFLRRERLELRLLQQLNQARTLVQLVLRHLVEVRTELRERSQLAVLSEIQLQRRTDLLGRLERSRESYARYRQTNVNRWTYARVEQIGFHEDLTDTSPACVSMIGRAVSEPPPNSFDIFAERSSKRECR